MQDQVADVFVRDCPSAAECGGLYLSTCLSVAFASHRGRPVGLSCTIQIVQLNIENRHTDDESRP